MRIDPDVSLVAALTRATDRHAAGQVRLAKLKADFAALRERAEYLGKNRDYIRARAAADGKPCEPMPTQDELNADSKALDTAIQNTTRDVADNGRNVDDCKKAVLADLAAKAAAMITVEAVPRAQAALAAALEPYRHAFEALRAANLLLPEGAARPPIPRLPTDWLTVPMVHEAARDLINRICAVEAPAEKKAA